MGALSGVYERLPMPLRSVALSLYACRLAWIRYGGSYRHELASLRASETLDASTLRRAQNDALTDLIRVATTESDYYRGLGLDPERVDLDSLAARVPILTKSTLREQQRRIEIPRLAGAGSFRINTSGTTGTPLNVLVSRRAIRKNYAFFSRFLGWGGVHVRDRSATFAGRILVAPERDRPPFWLFNAVTNTMHYSSYHLSPETAEHYLRSLESLQPKYIDSYPSAIFALARVQNALGRRFDVNPAVIVTSSETLLEHQREEIERAFECRVMDQYGSAELAGFVSECEKGTYHAHPEYGVVEIVDDSGSPVRPGHRGRLILTGFINPATPLLRYEIGDTAVAGDGTCSCGRHFPVVAEISGRRDDVIVTPDGREVGRLDPVFKGVEGVLESQIVQDRSDHVSVLVVPTSGKHVPAASVERLQRELGKRLGASMSIEVRVVESIPRTRAGKFRSVVSTIRADGAR